MDNKERVIMIELSLKEAALIRLLRENPFGVIEVSTHEGNPIRCVVKASKILQDQDGLMMVAKPIPQDRTKLNDLLQEQKT